MSHPRKVTRSVYGAALFLLREADFGEIAHHDGVDASFFVSCGAVKPSLTIIANALRVGEHLRGRLATPPR